MKAKEIIPATHRLEQSGMTRNEAEAVVSELQRVVAPLATKDDLASLEKFIRSDTASACGPGKPDFSSFRLVARVSSFASIFFPRIA